MILNKKTNYIKGSLIFFNEPQTGGWYEKVGSYKKGPSEKRDYYKNLLIKSAKQVRAGLADDLGKLSKPEGEDLRRDLKLAKLEELKTKNFSVKVTPGLFLSAILASFARRAGSRKSSFDSKVILANLSGSTNEIDGNVFNVDELHAGEVVTIKENVLTILAKDKKTIRARVNLFPIEKLVLKEEGRGEDNINSDSGRDVQLQDPEKFVGPVMPEGVIPEPSTEVESEAYRKDASATLVPEVGEEETPAAANPEVDQEDAPVATNPEHRVDTLNLEDAQNLIVEILGKRLSRFSRNVQEAREWAIDISGEMQNAGLPLTKQNIVLVTLTIERESAFHEVPLIHKPEEILKRAFAEYRAKWPEIFTAVSLVYPLENLEREGLEYIAKIKEKNLQSDKYIVIDGVRREGMFTEGDLNDAIDYAIAKINDSFTLSSIPGLREKINSFRPETAGAMQININKAVKLAEKHDQRQVDGSTMRAELNSRRAGLRYGILNLKEIIDSHRDESGKIPDEKIDFAFVDYNMGIYTTRNAALQVGMNSYFEIIGGIHNLIEVDGDMLMYDDSGKPKTDISQTEKAIRDIFAYNNVQNISSDQIRADLLREKTPDFSATLTYRALYETFKLSQLEVAENMIPETTSTESKVKFGQSVNAKKYAMGSRSRYNAMIKI